MFDLIRGSLESCHGDPVGPEQSFRWYASDVMVASKTDLVLKDGDREVEPCTTQTQVRCTWSACDVRRVCICGVGLRCARGVYLGCVCRVCGACTWGVL